MPDVGARAASRASLAVALLTLAALLCGIAILGMVGGASGGDLAGAAPEKLRAAFGLMVAAELLKLATAAATVFAILGIRARLLGASPSAGLATGAGLTGALAIAASGFVGLAGLLQLDSAGRPAVLALMVPIAGVVLAAGGLWFLLASLADGSRAWLRVLGVVLGVVSIAAALFQPLGLAAALLAIPWWIGQSRRLAALP